MYSVCASNSCCLQGSGMHQQKDHRWADLFKNGVSQKANGLSRSIMTFPHSTWHYWGIPHWTSPFAYWSLISCSCFHIFIDTYFIGKLHASLISLMLLPISAGDSDLGSFGFLGLGPIFRSFQVAACERWQSKLFICQKSSGWWLTYPSEKWWSSSVGMMIFPIITIIIIIYIWRNETCSKPPTSHSVQWRLRANSTQRCCLHSKEIDGEVGQGHPVFT